MPAVSLTPIANTKVKLRFKERYASEGLNIKALANTPAGIYRGFLLAENLIADRTVTVKVDATRGDSVATYETLDGYALTIREPADVSLDLSSVAGQTVVIAVYAHYVIGSATSSEYRAYPIADWDANPPEKNELIVLGTVAVPSGAIPIPAVNMTYDRRTSSWSSVAPEAVEWSPLVKNGSFEWADAGESYRHAITDWELGAATNAAFSASTTGSRTGGKCLELNTTNTINVSALIGQFIECPVIAGQRGLARFYVKQLISPTLTANGSLDLVWGASDGSVLSTTSIPFISIGTTDSSYRVIEQAVTAPASAAFLKWVSIQLTTQTFASTGTALRIDDVQVYLETGSKLLVPGRAESRCCTLTTDGLIIGDPNTIAPGAPAALLRYDSSANRLYLESKDGGVSVPSFDVGEVTFTDIDANSAILRASGASLKLDHAAGLHSYVDFERADVSIGKVGFTSNGSTTLELSSVSGHVYISPGSGSAYITASGTTFGTGSNGTNAILYLNGGDSGAGPDIAGICLRHGGSAGWVIKRVADTGELHVDSNESGTTALRLYSSGNLCVRDGVDGYGGGNLWVGCKADTTSLFLGQDGQNTYLDGLSFFTGTSSVYGVPKDNILIGQILSGAPPGTPSGLPLIHISTWDNSGSSFMKTMSRRYGLVYQWSRNQSGPENIAAELRADGGSTRLTFSAPDPSSSGLPRLSIAVTPGGGAYIEPVPGYYVMLGADPTQDVRIRGTLRVEGVGVSAVPATFIVDDQMYQIRLERAVSGTGAVYIGGDSFGFRVGDSSANSLMCMNNTGYLDVLNGVYTGYLDCNSDYSHLYIGTGASTGDTYISKAGQRTIVGGSLGVGVAPAVPLHVYAGASTGAISYIEGQAGQYLAIGVDATDVYLQPAVKPLAIYGTSGKQIQINDSSIYTYSPTYIGYGVSVDSPKIVTVTSNSFEYCHEIQASFGGYSAYGRTYYDALYGRWDTYNARFNRGDASFYTDTAAFRTIGTRLYGYGNQWTVWSHAPAASYTFAALVDSFTVTPAVVPKTISTGDSIPIVSVHDAGRNHRTVVDHNGLLTGGPSIILREHWLANPPAGWNITGTGGTMSNFGTSYLKSSAAALNFNATGQDVYLSTDYRFFYNDADRVTVAEWEAAHYCSDGSTNNVAFVMGFSAAAHPNESKAYFYFNQQLGPGYSIHIQSYTEDASGSEMKSCSVQPGAGGTKHRYRIEIYGANMPGGARVLFYIDGALKTEHTAYVPYWQMYGMFVLGHVGTYTQPHTLYIGPLLVAANRVSPWLSPPSSDDSI